MKMKTKSKIYWLTVILCEGIVNNGLASTSNCESDSAPNNCEDQSDQNSQKIPRLVIPQHIFNDSPSSNSNLNRDDDEKFITSKRLPKQQLSRQSSIQTMFSSEDEDAEDAMDLSHHRAASPNPSPRRRSSIHEMFSSGDESIKSYNYSDYMDSPRKVISRPSSPKRLPKQKKSPWKISPRKIFSSTDENEQNEENLAEIIHFLIKKNFEREFQSFIQVALQGFEELLNQGKINECSLEELFQLSLGNPEAFYYVTRNKRPPRQAVAVYGYASQAVTDENGILNKVKHNVMDEILFWISTLTTPNISQEAINQLESFLNDLLCELAPALKNTIYEVLQSDFIGEYQGCCGCCKKLDKRTKLLIIRGLSTAIKATIDRFLGAGFTAGIGDLARGIFSTITHK